MNHTLPEEIETLIQKRNRLRSEKKYQESDEVRKQIEDLGYKIVDTPSGTTVEKKETSLPITSPFNHLIAVFGSGEMSPTGRRVHEYVIKDISPPVSIALLETPAGFEENPLNWYKKLADMMAVGLQNVRPEITIVEALRKDGEKSTNNPKLLKPVINAHYVHTGAGSPTYAAKHLKDSLAYQYLIRKSTKGSPLSFASAAAIAFSRYVLPVYEIYKVGEDLHWKEGLDFFSRYGLNITIIPHWNNSEGESDIDTSRCFMGKKRFNKLMKILPGPTTILGIDEQTACIFDTKNQKIKVMGNGGAYVFSKKTGGKSFLPDETFSFDDLH